MEKVVTWSKGIFESSYQIHCNGEICGSLIFNTWNNHAFGIMRKNNYHFKANGFTDLTTTIYGINNEKIGQITFQIWQFKAVISLTGQPDFTWQYTNSWLSQWRMNNGENLLHYKATNGKGMVVGKNLEDELGLLVGIYVKEYFARIFVAIIGFILIMGILRRF